MCMEFFDFQFFPNRYLIVSMTQKESVVILILKGKAVPIASEPMDIVLKTSLRLKVAFKDLSLRKSFEKDKDVMKNGGACK